MAKQNAVGGKLIDVRGRTGSRALSIDGDPVHTDIVGNDDQEIVARERRHREDDDNEQRSQRSVQPYGGMDRQRDDRLGWGTKRRLL